MCDFGGRLPTTDVYNVACCDPNDGNEYCQAGPTNTCSASYNDQRHNFYTYCPKINATGCGIYNTGGEFLIEASTEKKTFTYSGLRYKTREYKFKSIDSCYYQVQNPTYYYTSGNVYLKFTEIEDGVNVYLNAGANVRNNSETLVNNNQTV